MANTYVDYTAVASQTDYNFSFEYLRDEHVKVKVDDVIVTNYTIVTSPVQLIRFDTAPTASAEIRIYRDSRGDFSPLVDFVDGSVLTENELDEAYRHNLFVSQEASEGTGNELLNKKGGANYDAEGNKIINLGTPGASTDAANKGYVDQTIDNAIALGGSPAIVSLGGYDVTAFGTSITKSLANWTNDLNSPTATGSTTARTLADRFADEVNVLDYGAYNDGTNAEATRTAIQAAMDSGSAIIFFPQGEYIIDKPLRAKSGHAQNLTIRGQSRVSTKIKPASVDISDELGINSLFINQENDGKLSFENIRFISDIGAYTGNAIYCVEDGSNSQVIFSGRINNCWFSLANTNTGYLVGGVNNYTISNNVFEFAKNCFRLEGFGNGDISFLNNIVYSSYDNFINAAADTNTKNNITVSGLRFIGHNRGPLFNLKNCSRWTIDNVIIENNLAGSTDVGVADIENCTNLSLSNIVFERVLPDGVVTNADAFKITTSTGIQISDTILNDLNNGFVLTGTNEITLNLDNVRLTNVATNWVLCDSTPSGYIKIRNCDFRNSGTNGISSTGSTPSFDMLIEDSFLINSGVSGSSANRNIYMNTSGDVMVRGCHIGLDAVSALAGYFIENDGTGIMNIYDPVIVGTAPIGVNAPGSSGELRTSGNVFGEYVIYRDSSAPTTGTWNTGDIVLNNGPTAGGTVGWVCVSGGTPGTWKTFGTIAT